MSSYSPLFLRTYAYAGLLLKLEILCRNATEMAINCGFLCARVFISNVERKCNFFSGVPKTLKKNPNILIGN